MSYFKSYHYDPNVLTVFIDIITICQQHCWYCYARPESRKDAQWNKILPLAKIQKILDALSHSKYIIDLCILGGEPTLHKDLKVILSQVVSIKNIRKIEVYSNGLRNLEPFIMNKVTFNLSLHSSQTDGLKLVHNAKKLVGKAQFSINCLYDGESENFYNCIELLQKNDLFKYAKLGIVDSHREDRPLTIKVPDLPMFQKINEKEFELNGVRYTLDEIREQKLNDFHGWKCYKSLIKIFVDGKIIVSGGDYKSLSLEQLKNYTKICDICSGHCCHDENNLIFNYKEKND